MVIGLVESSKKTENFHVHHRFLGFPFVRQFEYLRNGKFFARADSSRIIMCAFPEEDLLLFALRAPFLHLLAKIKVDCLYFLR